MTNGFSLQTLVLTLDFKDFYRGELDTSFNRQYTIAHGLYVQDETTYTPDIRRILFGVGANSRVETLNETNAILEPGLQGKLIKELIRRGERHTTLTSYNYVLEKRRYNGISVITEGEAKDAFVLYAELYKGLIEEIGKVRQKDISSTPEKKFYNEFIHHVVTLSIFKDKL
jgi:hypothetical protein